MRPEHIESDTARDDDDDPEPGENQLLLRNLGEIRWTLRAIKIWLGIGIVGGLALGLVGLWR